MTVGSPNPQEDPLADPTPGPGPTRRIDAVSGAPTYSTPVFEGDEYVAGTPVELPGDDVGRGSRNGVLAGLASVTLCGVAFGVGYLVLAGGEPEVSATGPAPSATTPAPTVTQTTTATATVTVTSEPRVVVAGSPRQQRSYEPSREASTPSPSDSTPEGGDSVFANTDEKQAYIDRLVRDYLRQAVDGTMTRSDMNRYFMPTIDWYSAKGKSRDSLYASISKPSNGPSTRFDEPDVRSFTPDVFHSGQRGDRITYHMSYTRPNGDRGAVYVSYVLVAGDGGRPRIAKVSETPA